MISAVRKTALFIYELANKFIPFPVAADQFLLLVKKSCYRLNFMYLDIKSGLFEYKMVE